MDSSSERDSRVLSSFWVACGLAATGAIAPLLLEGVARGTPGGTIPFGIATIALGANALTYPRGRSTATALYVLAWLAIVYGIIQMIAVTLQQAVVGSCQGAGGECSPKFADAFAGGQGIAIGIGVITGALALQTGLYGLRILYRGHRQLAASPATATAPPTRVIPPHKTATAPPPQVEIPAAAQAVVPEETDAGVPPPMPEPARKPRTRRAPKPAAELAAPVEPAELPAHPEPAELPPHPNPTEPPSGSTTSSS